MRQARWVHVPGETPVAVNDSVTILRGTPSVTLNVLANDSDPDDPPSALTVTAVTQPPTGKGSVVLNPNGTITYFPPDASFYGDVTFTYTITDAAGNTSTATVTVTVNRR